MLPSDLGDDLELFESDWETEYEMALLDAEEWGLGFFIVFSDGTMGRSTIAEVSEIVDEWKKKVALS
jgi:hypothetical protein